MSRLHKLVVHNIQEIKDVAYEFDKNTNVLVVCGDNGAGKSTFLKAAEWLFCGDKPIPECPIREGEKTASIEGTTDDGYVVRKDFKYNKAGKTATTLTVRTDPNVPGIKSPQTYLWEQIKNQMIDPVRLAQKDPKDLRDIVVGLVNLEFDLEGHDKKWQEIYAKRTAAGYVVNQKKAFMVEIPLPVGWEELPREHVSAVDLNKQYQAAVEQNADNDRIKDDLETAKLTVTSYEKDISDVNDTIKNIDDDIGEANGQISVAESNVESVKQQINNLAGINTGAIEEEITRLQERLDAGRKKNMENRRIAESLEPLREKVVRCKADKERFLAEKIKSKKMLASTETLKKETVCKVKNYEVIVGKLKNIDLEAINLKIAGLQQTNDAISTVRAHFAAKKNWEDAVGVVTGYTENLIDMDVEKDDAISMCKFPVPGLSVDVKGLIYNQRRFEQASTAEKHEILISLQIALKPNAKWLIIHDVATWDKKTMARMTQKANNANFLFILERVDTDEVFENTSKLVIHGGEIVSKSTKQQLVAA